GHDPLHPPGGRLLHLPQDRLDPRGGRHLRLRRLARAERLSPTNALPCGGRSLPTGNVMSSTRFTLHLADLDWQVLAFEAVEAIGRPTRITLELVSSRADLELNGLLRQPARLTLDEGRALHGLVWGIEQTHCTPALSRYRLELRPALAWLAQRRNCRIFERLSVPRILEQLLAEHGLLGDSCRFALTGHYPPRDYCVQYAESDLHFLQRLCEEEGLHYHFQTHPEQSQVLVFGDDQSVFPRLEPNQCYRPDSGQPQQVPVIQRFAEGLESRSDTL